MTDAQGPLGETDPDRFATGENEEVQRFAEEHGITAADVLRLIRRHGNDRATLAEAARHVTPGHTT